MNFIILLLDFILLYVHIRQLFTLDVTYTKIIKSPSSGSRTCLRRDEIAPVFFMLMALKTLEMSMMVRLKFWMISANLQAQL